MRRGGNQKASDDLLVFEVESPRKQARPRKQRVAAGGLVLFLVVVVLFSERVSETKSVVSAPSVFLSEKAVPAEKRTDLSSENFEMSKSAMETEFGSEALRPPLERAYARPDVGVLAFATAAEGVFLREWIEYHVLLGVGKFWIVAEKESMSVLRPFVAAGVVVAFFGDCDRLPAMLEALYVEEVDARWVAVLKISEFLHAPLIRENEATSTEANELSHRRWFAPSVRDIVARLDAKHWAGLALPISLFGDGGHRTAVAELSTLASYGQRADPKRARNWRARSFTSLFQTDICESIRTDVQSSVHVCRRPRKGYPTAHIFTAQGHQLQPSHPTIPEDLRTHLPLTVARFTRSAATYAALYDGDTPPREFNEVDDASLRRSLETRLGALAFALVGEKTGGKHFGNLVALLLGRSYLTIQKRRPATWLVEALDNDAGGETHNNMTCLSCALLAKVGPGWELRYHIDDEPQQDDNILPEEEEGGKVPEASLTTEKPARKKDASAAFVKGAAKAEEAALLAALEDGVVNADDLLG